MTKGSRLISWPVFVIIFLIVCALFYIIFPKQQFFVNDDSKRDPVLLSHYLRAALVQKPGDQTLEQRLVEVLIRAQRWNKATLELTKLTDNGTHHQLLQSLIYHRWIARGAHPGQDLQALIASFRPIAQWTSQSLEYAKAAGLQGEVAQYYQSQKNYSKAAQFWMQDNQVQRALENYKKSISKDNYQQAINAALAGQQPQEALSWWQRFGDASDVKQTLKLAKLADDHEVREAAANTLLKQYPDNLDILNEALQAQIGNHDLQRAIHTNQKLLTIYPNDHLLHYQLWQLAIWSDHVDLAMAQLHWLMVHDPKHTEQSAQKMLPMVAGLFRYQDEITIYRYLSSQHDLSTQQFSDWMLAHYYLGDLQQMLQDIRTYEQENGKSLSSQYWQLKVFYEEGLLDRVRHLWPSYAGPDTAQTRLWFARSFWLVNKNQTALHILQTPPADAATAYFASMGQIAGMVGNEKQELFAYRQLKQLGPVSLGIEFRYRQLQFAHNAPALLKYLWQQPKTPANLVDLAQISMQLDNRASMVKVASSLGRQPESAALTQAWLTLGQWYQSHQQYRLAKQTLLKAQEFAVNPLEAELSLGWLALDSGNRADEEAILSAHQSEPINLQWAPLLSSLALQLGDYQNAYRYLHWCVEHQPNDLAYWVNLSDVFTQMNMTNAAWKTNRYLLAHLPHNQNAYQQLLAQWDANSAFAYLRHSTPIEKLALSMSDQPQAQWWLHRRAVKLLPAWQQLQQSMHDGQFFTMRQLVAQNKLTPADQANALVAMNQPYRAMQDWLDMKNSTYQANDYDFVRSVRSSFFRAIEVNLQPDAQLSTSEQQLNIYFPAAGVQWKAGLSKVNNLGNDGEQIQLQGQYSHGRWDVEGRLDSFQGTHKNRHGLMGNFGYQATQRLRLGASLAWHTRTDQNELLLAFAQQNQIRLSGAYALTNKQQLSLSAAQWQIKLDGSERSVASGQQFQSRYDFRLLDQAPQWELYSTINWQRINSSHTRTITAAHGRQTSMTAYRRIALGTEFGPGIEFTPPYLGVSPTWQIDLSGGYQPNVKQADFAASAGIGWSVLSDDLLGLQTRYQTRNRSGKSDLQLQLSYYVHF